MHAHGDTIHNDTHTHMNVADARHRPTKCTNGPSLGQDCHQTTNKGEGTCGTEKTLA